VTQTKLKSEPVLFGTKVGSIVCRRSTWRKLGDTSRGEIRTCTREKKRSTNARISRGFCSTWEGLSEYLVIIRNGEEEKD